MTRLLRTHIVTRAILGALLLSTLIGDEAFAMTFICPLVYAGDKYYPARTEDAPDGRPVSEADLGPLVIVVNPASLDIGGGPGGSGCPSPQPAGSHGVPVYAFRGYRPQFRLIVRRDGRLQTYEVRTRQGAVQGGDLLDIAGRVTRVTIRRSRATPPNDTHQLHWRVDVDDQQRVKDIVDLVVVGALHDGVPDGCAPVKVLSKNPTIVHSFLSYTLVFQMADGTIVRRFYFPSNGALEGPIYVQNLRELMDAIFEAAGVRFDDCGPGRR